MNKTIATAAIAGVAILSPVAAMSVTPVRDALLGLAPEEQIVALADEIDKSRVENEQKLASLEQELASTKQKNAELEEVLASQAVKVEEQKQTSEAQKAEVATVSARADKQAECSELYRTNQVCTQERYRSKDAFEKMIDDIKDSEPDDVKPRTKFFNKCQEIIAKCG
jgi:septal ring factor EnvC (AmiA/AmiB activator)